MRDAVKGSVRFADAGTPLKLTGASLYEKTGKTTWKTVDGWLNTYVHEMGHQIHFPCLVGHFSVLVRRSKKRRGLTGIALAIFKRLLRIESSTGSPANTG